jgi:hypothetical protein
MSVIIQTVLVVIGGLWLYNFLIRIPAPRRSHHKITPGEAFYYTSDIGGHDD